ncbi:MAG: copper amine oxidase N-terminal domain-containing protein [Clostridia bacterium]|nr:copper amine oxidase N-terminal domain-containing protein [Clostridia bacterium]
MKTRKLFAILTLVAFMMTLLPVAAFADDAVKSASKISLDATSKAVGNNNKVKVTVALRDSKNQPATNLKSTESLYIWAERAKDSISEVDVPITVPSTVYTVYNVSMIKFDSVSSGDVEVGYTSNIAGEVVFKAAIAPTTITTPPTPSNLESYLIGTASFTWKQRGADKIELVAATDKKDNTDLKEFIKEDNGQYKFVEKEDNGQYKDKLLSADGREYELTFEVKAAMKDPDNPNNTIYVPLSGEKVTFELNKSGANLNKTEATTDVLGKVKVKVYAYKADKYKLTVTRGSIVTVVEMDFGASTKAFEIEAPEPTTDKIAIGHSPSLEFKLYDVFGNRLTAAKPSDIDNFDNFEVVFTKKPSGSDLEDDDLSLDFKDNVLKVVFDQGTDVAGLYEVRVKLDNGKFAIVAFEAAEQGKISRMVLDIKESYLAYGSKSSPAKVKYYDDNNVYYEDTNLAAVELSVSNSALAKIEDKKVVARTPDYNDYDSGKVVVTAINTARGLVATDEIIIGSRVAGLEVTVPEEDALVNEGAVITYQLVNQNGEPIAFYAGDNKNKIDVDVYVVSQPEGSDVDINLPLKSDYQNSLSRTGKIDVEVECDTEGTVVLAFVVKGVVEEGKDPITLSNTTEVKFVAERVKIGAENVTLFIGSTNYVVDGQPKVSDLAPFIQDNRTFVPVRVVGEALGAEVEWDEATQTVTIAREDLTATLTIGSNEITLSDGTVVVSDVAPFIKDGRTVLPFRVIGEIFGADVEAVSAADGRTIAVTFEQ